MIVIVISIILTTCEQIYEKMILDQEVTKLKLYHFNSSLTFQKY